MPGSARASEVAADEPEARRSAHVSSDSLFLILTDTLSHWEADPSSPFRILNSRMQLDSLGYAVETLLDYNRERDSTKLVIRDINDRPSTLWLTSGSNESTRFWAKNFKNDSITFL